MSFWTLREGAEAAGHRWRRALPVIVVMGLATTVLDCETLLGDFGTSNADAGSLLEDARAGTPSDAEQKPPAPVNAAGVGDASSHPGSAGADASVDATLIGDLTSSEGVTGHSGGEDAVADDASCVDSCAIGSGRCVEGGLSACVAVPAGCSVWSPASACPDAMPMCAAGACVLCVPGTTQCAGTVPQICNMATQWVNGQVIAGTCGAVCTPGASAPQCNGLVPQTCGPSGLWQDAAACPFLCSGGACTGVCVPGTTECTSTNATNDGVQTCDSTGQWSTTACQTCGNTNIGTPLALCSTTCPGGGAQCLVANLPGCVCPSESSP